MGAAGIVFDGIPVDSMVLVVLMAVVVEADSELEMSVVDSASLLAVEVTLVVLSMLVTVEVSLMTLMVTLISLALDVMTSAEVDNSLLVVSGSVVDDVSVTVSDSISDDVSLAVSVSVTDDVSVIVSDSIGNVSLTVSDSAGDDVSLMVSVDISLTVTVVLFTNMPLLVVIAVTFDDGLNSLADEVVVVTVLVPDGTVKELLVKEGMITTTSLDVMVSDSTGESLVEGVEVTSTSMLVVLFRTNVVEKVGVLSVAVVIADAVALGKKVLSEVAVWLAMEEKLEAVMTSGVQMVVTMQDSKGFGSPTETSTDGNN